MNDKSWMFRLENIPYNDVSFSLSTRNLKPLAQTDQAQASLYSAWYDVLADYSNRHLTFAEDQLPALAGITDEFAKGLEDRSIFGLWTNDIHRGILFFEPNRFEQSPESKIVPTWNGSPSWSWLGRGKSVLWDTCLQQATMQRICNICFVPPSGLKLSGPLLPRPSKFAYSSSWEDEGPRYFFILGSDKEGFMFTWYQDGWFDSTVEECLADMTRPSTPEDPEAAPQYQEDSLVQGADITGGLSNVGTDTSSSTRRPSTPDERTQHNRAKAFLGNILIMPILCYVKPIKNENYCQEGTVMGLLLHQSPGADRGVYRRVGIMEAEIRGDSEMDVHTVQQRFEAYRQPLDPQLFQEEDHYGNYVVTVL
ncbi:hypothetical protein AA0117_g9420 [Alternaria alternata]|nr:hypothetical protein AA0118_g9310 [Alternaria tenuissima]RYN71602.1 hypothetical protein AA0117_g9420 [Alternaria alternata]